MRCLICLASRRPTRWIVNFPSGHRRALVQVSTQRVLSSRIGAKEAKDSEGETGAGPAAQTQTGGHHERVKGSSSGWDWKQWLTLGVASVGAAAAFGGLLYNTVYGQAELAAARISAGTLGPVQLLSGVDALIERKNVQDKILASLKDMTVVLLYGPRGAGKSTAVGMALENRRPVVKVTVSHDDKGFLGDFILSTLRGRAPDGSNGDTVVEEALKILKQNSSSTIPIVIVDVGSKCSGQQLQDVLLLCKHWGPDEQLAKFIVDVSSSRAALQLSIALKKLRVTDLKVGELSQEEAECYLIKLLGPCMALEGDWRADGTTCTLAQHAVERMGKVVLDLWQLARSCQPFKDDAHSLQQQIDQCVMICDLESYGTLLAFLDDLKTMELLTGFKDLLSKMVDLDVVDSDELSAVVGGKDRHLIELNASRAPHVLDIDPFTRRVSLSSVSMRSAVKRYLQEDKQRQEEEQRQRAWWWRRM